jgi:hypothetical protein
MKNPHSMPYNSLPETARGRLTWWGYDPVVRMADAAGDLAVTQGGRCALGTVPRRRVPHCLSAGGSGGARYGGVGAGSRASTETQGDPDGARWVRGPLSPALPRCTDRGHG